MGAQIIPLMQRRLRPAFPRDWTPQELAEFYRVESALLQAGLELESERGVSDEGDPWFVFCRADTGEVFIHFARVDGDYVVDGAAFAMPARGHDFSSLVRDLVARHPLANVRRPGSNVFMHPAALLIALVGAAFFHSGKAKAAEPSHTDAPADARPEGRRALVVDMGSSATPATAEGARAVALDAGEVAAVLAGVAIGLRQLASAAPSDPGLQATVFRAASPAPALPAALPAAIAAAAALADASALDAAAARAALTVMAAFHELAVTPAPASAAAPVVEVAPSGGLPVAAPAIAAAALPAAAPVASGADAGALLWVHLVGGPLPEMAALSLVVADGALAFIGADRLVHVDQLPQLITDIINHGETVDPAAAAPAAPAAAASTAPAPPTVDHGAPHTVDDSGATAPAGVTDTPPATIHKDPSLTVPPAGADASTSPVAPASPTSPADVAAAAAAHTAAMNAAILSFVNHVNNVQMVVSGHEVVIYDPMILTGFLLPSETLDSVTFKFDDGSSVSLVGTAAELHDLHGLG